MVVVLFIQIVSLEPLLPNCRGSDWYKSRILKISKDVFQSLISLLILRIYSECNIYITLFDSNVDGAGK